MGAAVDYSNESSITSVLKHHNVEIVASTIGTEDSATITAQLVVARAAKATGTIKLFVTSDFGSGIARHDEPVLGDKTRALEEIRDAVGLPTLSVHNGLFSEYIPSLSTSLKYPGKVAILEGFKGETKWSTTSLGDITGEYSCCPPRNQSYCFPAFTAHILSHTPYDLLQNQNVYIEGDALSFLDISRLTGKEIVHVQREDLANPFAGILQAKFEDGTGRTSYDADKPDVSDSGLTERARSGHVLWKEYVFKKVTPESLK